MEALTDSLVLEMVLGLIALLYATTGHGGASGYIAVMVLLGMTPANIKPLALVLNVVVSALATVLFYRAGHFRWRWLWPFMLGSIPCAMLGGYWQLPTHWFNVLLGVVLLFAACRLGIRPLPYHALHAPTLPLAITLGGAIGLMSGLLGIGGGILLTPLLLLLGWANPKQAAAISAPFILLNSLSGLLGFGVLANQAMPHNPAPLVLAVALGGWVGAHLGSRVLPMRAVAGALSAVLMLASFKLFYV